MTAPTRADRFAELRDIPQCSCMRVVHVTVHYHDGTCSERWECNACRTEFARLPRVQERLGVDERSSTAPPSEPRDGYNR